MWTSLKRLAWRWRGVCFAVPIVTLVVIPLRGLGLLQILELAAYDQLILLRQQVVNQIQPPPVDSRIVIVTINEPDLNQFRNWPMTDATLAELLQKIRQQSPRMIGLDIYRPWPVGAGQDELQKIWQSTPNLIGIEKVIASDASSAVPAPQALTDHNQVGANDISLDTDAKARRAFLALDDKSQQSHFSFSFILACRYLDPPLGDRSCGVNPDNSLWIKDPSQPAIPKTSVPRLQVKTGGYQRVDDQGYQVLINYQGTIERFTTVSKTDVMADRIPPGIMRDRIVLIGTTAESLRDLYYTPYSSSLLRAPAPMPGVVIHANAISQLLAAAIEGRPLLRTWPHWLEGVWIVGCSIVSGVWTWKVRYLDSQGSQGFSKLGLPIEVVVLTGAMLVGSLIAFFNGWWLPLVPTHLVQIGTSIGINIYIARTATAIREVFGRYVTDQVVAALLENPEGLKIGGERRQVTVLTSDLRGFTATSERLPPEEVVKILNIYLAAMTDVINTYQGTIDAFIGDGILVLFGAPTPRDDDAIRSVACAIAMQQAMPQLNERIQALSGITLEMGIGINTGEVVVGNIGSEKHAKYSVIGNQVNLAYRVEGFTIGGQIFISEATYHHVQSIVTIQNRTQVQAKGIPQPIWIYDVSAIGEPYHLALPASQETFVTLVQPIAVHYHPLEGKEVLDKTYQGAIVALSDKGAHLQIDPEAIALTPVLTNLKLQLVLPEEPELAHEEIYAKVLAVTPEAADLKPSLQLRFTAKSPRMEMALNRQIQK